MKKGLFLFFGIIILVSGCSKKANLIVRGGYALEQGNLSLSNKKNPDLLSGSFSSEQPFLSANVPLKSWEWLKFRFLASYSRTETELCYKPNNALDCTGLFKYRYDSVINVVELEVPFLNSNITSLGMGDFGLAFQLGINSYDMTVRDPTSIVLFIDQFGALEPFCSVVIGLPPTSAWAVTAELMGCSSVGEHNIQVDVGEEEYTMSISDWYKARLAINFRF